MFSGAGTNLKTLEFLSSGMPLVSTKVGVRGLELIDGKHFILGEKNNFEHALLSLQNNPKKRKSIAENGRKFINENYSWETISQTMFDELNGLKEKKQRNTLLLLNDFEVTNPSSGGEIRINQLYSALSKKYLIILLTLTNQKELTITEITDQFIQISFPKSNEHRQEQKKINNHYH